jgi:hypothetical protein
MIQNGIRHELTNPRVVIDNERCAPQVWLNSGNKAIEVLSPESSVAAGSNSVAFYQPEVAPAPRRIGVHVKQVRYLTHSEESVWQLIPLIIPAPTLGAFLCHYPFPLLQLFLL